MAGEISYVEGFERRLNLLHPTIDQMNSFLRNWNPTLTSGVKEFISYLQNNRKLVYLVSGGLSHVWLYSVSQSARISGEWQAEYPPRSCFVQWNLLFEWFVQWLWSLSAHKLSPRQMLAHTGKKGSVMIGDGATDLETKDVVDAFICFTGVKDRPSVSSQGDLVIASFHDLLPLLPSPFF